MTGVGGLSLSRSFRGKRHLVVALLAEIMRSGVIFDQVSAVYVLNFWNGLVALCITERGSSTVSK